MWHNHDRWLELMAAHGWEPGVIGWNRNTHRGNRRNAAADAWGVENGTTDPRSEHHGDWHRLRAMGLME